MRGESITRSVVLFIVLCAMSCGQVSTKHQPDGGRTTDSGARACVFDADHFDGGCTFGN